jgi:serine/threonine protein kinase
MMDHPNIAKVFDGGVVGQASSLSSDSRQPGSLPHGQPYFVMELVNGLPLTKYCDEAKLTPRQRMELFVPICQAVQHAHQKGIVHRDLKPPNILVTLYDGKPVPKIIDFGIANRVKQQSEITQRGTVRSAMDGRSVDRLCGSSDQMSIFCFLNDASHLRNDQRSRFLWQDGHGCDGILCHHP